MAAHSGAGQVGTHDRGDSIHPLAPLNRDELDWEVIYQIYRELPPCERRVLDLLVGRHDLKRIAGQLQVSYSTVRNQVDSMKQKLDAGSLPELVGLVTIALYEEARRSSLATDST